MRGKAETFTVADLLVGITPAYAGKRAALAVGSLRKRDHPRLCGEKLSIHTRQKKRSGSPPPMRGKAELHEDRENWHGITPAYAGKSM